MTTIWYCEALHLLSLVTGLAVSWAPFPGQSLLCNILSLFPSLQGPLRTTHRLLSGLPPPLPGAGLIIEIVHNRLQGPKIKFTTTQKSILSTGIFSHSQSSLFYPNLFSQPILYALPSWSLAIGYRSVSPKLWSSNFIWVSSQKPPAPWAPPWHSSLDLRVSLTEALHTGWNFYNFLITPPTLHCNLLLLFIEE